MLNQVILQGRISNDLELKQTQSGINVLHFNVACNRPKGKDGNAICDFIPCTAFNKTAEVINQYCTKGSEIIIVGAIHVTPYTDKNGNKRTDYQVAVNEIQFTSGSHKDGKKEEAPAEPKPTYEAVEDDAELPF